MKLATMLAIASLTCGTAYAGAIESACNKSARTAATPSVCSCIQQVANKKLNGNDQRLAAKFFINPQLAQDTRQSNNRAHESFWKRYKSWGVSAEKNCS